MGVTQDELVNVMEDLYWTSAHRELCNMLLFFPEMRKTVGTDKAKREIPSCQNFENMFRVWSNSARTLPILVIKIEH